METITPLTNPRKITWFFTRFSDRARGVKFYRTGFDMPGKGAKFSARTFSTAIEADQYGIAVLLRWMRLYDAALVNLSASPAGTEEARVVKA